MLRPKQLRNLAWDILKGTCCLQTSNVDHQVVRGKVIQNIPLGFIAKGQESSQGHKQASDHGYEGRIVGYCGEPIHCGGLEGPINQKTVVV